MLRCATCSPRSMPWRRASRRGAYLVDERLTEADPPVPDLGQVRRRLLRRAPLQPRRLADYPHLLAYTNRILAIPGVAATVKLDHVKRHYWDDHEMINRRIVPIGPTVDFCEPIAARAA